MWKWLCVEYITKKKWLNYASNQAPSVCIYILLWGISIPSEQFKHCMLMFFAYIFDICPVLSSSDWSAVMTLIICDTVATSMCETLKNQQGQTCLSSACLHRITFRKHSSGVQIHVVTSRHGFFMLIKLIWKMYIESMYTCRQILYNRLIITKLDWIRSFVLLQCYWLPNMPCDKWMSELDLFTSVSICYHCP